MDIPIEIKKQIIATQRQMWLNSQFDVIIATRVAKKIGEDEQRIEQLKTQAEKCEKALAALDEEEKELK